MNLCDIPLELRLTIAEYVDPKSCFTLALTCREYYRLCASLLATHRTLWQRYNKLNMANAGRLLWDITKEVIENGAIAYYIEDVSLPVDRQMTWDEGRDLDMWKYACHNQLPEDVVRLFADAAREPSIMRDVVEADDYDPHFYGSNWNMEQSIRVGAEEPIAAILLSRLPYLRIFRFTTPIDFNGTDELEGLLQRVAHAYQRPSIGLSLPFQNLRYFAVAYAGDEGCCEPLWLDLSLALPALQGFAASKMGGCLERGHGATAKNSQVREILLGYSFFDPEALEVLLSHIEALKVFAYENGGACVSDTGCFAPRRVAAALLKHAGHSLEELVLMGDRDGVDHSDIEFVSLHSFEKLRVLRCSWDTIGGELEDQSIDEESLPEGQFYTAESYDEERSFSLIDRLPRSLEALHLELVPEDETQWQALIDLVHKQDNAFPSLKRVYASRKRGESVQDLCDILKEKGLSYEQLPDYTRANYNHLAKLLEG